MRRSKLTPLEAIREKCRECRYSPLNSGTWRHQISECRDKGCSLWEHRPLSAKAYKAVMAEKYQEFPGDYKAYVEEKSNRLRAIAAQNKASRQAQQARAESGGAT